MLAIATDDKRMAHRVYIKSLSEPRSSMRMTPDTHLGLLDCEGEHRDAPDVVVECMSSVRVLFFDIL